LAVRFRGLGEAASSGVSRFRNLSQDFQTYFMKIIKWTAATGGRWKKSLKRERPRGNRRFRGAVS
jgi:hypothetical protein